MARKSSHLLPPELLSETGIQPWSTDPNKTREQLLQLASFELLRGMEVISVLKENHQVIGVRARHLATGDEREFLANYTIGDDGVHSRIREACGIELKTKLFPLDLLCFGFDWPKTLKPATGRVWVNTELSRNGIFALLAVPLPEGKGAGVVAVRAKIFEPRFPVHEAWSRFCSRDAAIKEVVGERKFPDSFARVRRPWGHAARYGVEGAILLGDAAHPVTPIGGQGANMSVADACVLAELILQNDPNLLSKYESRRRSPNEHSITFSRRASLLWSLPDACFPPWVVKAGLNYLHRHSPSLSRRLLQAVSTAFQETPHRAHPSF